MLDSNLTVSLFETQPDESGYFGLAMDGTDVVLSYYDYGAASERANSNKGALAVWRFVIHPVVDYLCIRDGKASVSEHLVAWLSSTTKLSL